MTISSPPPKLLLSKHELTRTLLKKMRERYPQTTLTLIHSDKNPDEAHINIASADGQTLDCYTDSLYKAYQQTPDCVDQYYDNMLDTLDTFIPPQEDISSSLLPVILTQERIKEIQNNNLQGQRAGMTSESKTLIYLPYVENLYIAFVIDKANQIYYLYEEQLSYFYDIESKEDILPLALKNLQKKLPHLSINTSPLGITLHVDSEYESSMLLIYEQWKNVLPFKNNPVIVIAARDTVIMVDGADTAKINSLQKMATGIYNQINDAAISAQLFSIDEGQLFVYNKQK